MKINAIAPNQTEVIVNNVTVFVSYNTPVAAIIDGRVYRTSKKWSVTTSKHINQWLEGMIAEEKDQEFFDNLLQ